MKNYRPDQIANYFLTLVNDETGDAISNLKLQKLCYYAQGLAVATRGQPLFTDPVEAWTHGPVVPSLYRRYKDYGANPLSPQADFSPEVIDAADQGILNDVFAVFGQYSAWKLRDMTHEEAPWKSAYERAPGSAISVESLAEYFNNEVSDDYRATYNAKAEG